MTMIRASACRNREAPRLRMLVEQLPQFGELLLREAAVFDQVDDERRERAFGELSRGGFQLLARDGLARAGRGEEMRVAAAVAVDEALPLQPLEERMDGADFRLTSLR